MRSQNLGTKKPLMRSGYNVGAGCPESNLASSTWKADIIPLYEARISNITENN